MNGVISERQLGACVRAFARFFRDMERIDTQHGLDVTGTLNRLRPVECSQYEECHRAMKQRANKFCYKLGKTATRRVKCWCRCTGGKPWAENVFTLSRREGNDWGWATFGSAIDKQNYRNDREKATNASKIVWQLFCDRLNRRPLLIISGSCTNVVKCMLKRRTTILKVNKENLFVSFVLFVFW